MNDKLAINAVKTSNGMDQRSALTHVLIAIVFALLHIADTIRDKK